jgi:hypothetical protein
MKYQLSLTLLLFFLLLLTACSEKQKLLTRIDVQKLNENGVYEDVALIVDEEKLENIKKSFDKVKWNPNAEMKQASKADYVMTFFYEEEKNMPERLYEYQIWFVDNGTATLLSSEVSEGYGRLAKEHAEGLKTVLLPIVGY